MVRTLPLVVTEVAMVRTLPVVIDRGGFGENVASGG